MRPNTFLFKYIVIFKNVQHKCICVCMLFRFCMVLGIQWQDSVTGSLWIRNHSQSLLILFHSLQLSLDFYKPHHWDRTLYIKYEIYVFHENAPQGNLIFGNHRLLIYLRLFANRLFHISNFILLSDDCCDSDIGVLVY